MLDEDAKLIPALTVLEVDARERISAIAIELAILSLLIK